MIKFFHGVDDITANTHAKVNEFFLTSFKLLYPSIRHQLVDQSRRYIITGHSLGGAMATLLALKMTQYENVSWCIIFKKQQRQRYKSSYACVPGIPLQVAVELSLRTLNHRKRTKWNEVVIPCDLVIRGRGLGSRQEVISCCFCILAKKVVDSKGLLIQKEFAKIALSFIFFILFSVIKSN